MTMPTCGFTPEFGVGQLGTGTRIRNFSCAVANETRKFFMCCVLADRGQDKLLLFMLDVPNRGDSLIREVVCLVFERY